MLKGELEQTYTLHSKEQKKKGQGQEMNRQRTCVNLFWNKLEDKLIKGQKWIRRNNTVTKHKDKENHVLSCWFTRQQVGIQLNFATLRISISGKCLTWGWNCYQVQLMVFLRKRETRKRPYWHKLQRWKPSFSMFISVVHSKKGFESWFLDKHTFFSSAVFVFVFAKFEKERE